MRSLPLPSPARRAAALCLSSLIALSLAGVLAPPAMSTSLSSGPLSELTEAQQETTPTQTASTTNSATQASSNSSTVVVLVLGAAVLLLIGIAFVIVRDARRVAPAGDPQLAEATASHGAAVRLRKRRAKAKAARHQRKRNR
ncbi:MAG: hypothetical protein ABSG95_12735 [Solirubrobacteraceae bacterium]